MAARWVMSLGLAPNPGRHDEKWQHLPALQANNFINRRPLAVWYIKWDLFSNISELLGTIAFSCRRTSFSAIIQLLNEQGNAGAICPWEHLQRLLRGAF